MNLIMADNAFVFPCEFATCKKLTCNAKNIRKLKSRSFNNEKQFIDIE